MNPRRITTSIAAVTTLAAAVGVGYVLGNDPGSRDVPPGTRIALANADLTAAASCDELLDSYVERALEQVGAYGWGSGIVAFDSMGGADASAESSSPSGSSSTGVKTSRSTSNESGTNVQELGVDESDVVKVAGSLLLRLREGELLAYDVSGDEPTLLSSTRIDEARGNDWPGDPGGEMVFVDGRAVVLGSSDDGRSTTLTTVDLADPTSPSIVDTLTVQARASAVRLHGDVVRVVLQNGLPELDFSHPDGVFGELRSRMRNRGLVRATTLADWLPTADGEPIVDCEDVAIPEDEEIALGTTTVLALDPADPTARTSTAVATDSQTSYFSTDRFYLAATGPQWGFWGDCIDCRMGMTAPAAPRRSSPSRSTASTRRTSPPARSRAPSRTAGRWTPSAARCGSRSARAARPATSTPCSPCARTAPTSSRTAASTTSASARRSSPCGGSTTSRSWSPSARPTRCTPSTCPTRPPRGCSAS